METRKNKGYLIIECCTDRQQILYADNGACAVTDSSLEQLLRANPEQIARNHKTERIPLDTRHELWILERCDDSQYQTALEQLRQQNTELPEALRASEEENRAKSSFLSSMSHDIRTPMNAIIGMTSIGLSHIDEKPRVLDCLQKIQTASAHLMSLVNDVLDMSRIASGRMTLSEEPFSLADLVHDLTIIVRPQAAQKHQSLEIEIGKIYEENLIGDPLHLRQIFVNIIGNAVKYTQEEGSIHVKMTQRIDHTLDFLCEDNGIGMSPAFLEQIFVPFERVNTAAINKIEGTGLGMSIVKSLLDRMGGSITVESELNKGSRFQVILDLEKAEPSEVDMILPAWKMLVVDDDETSCRTAVDALDSIGIQADWTMSGEDAINMVEKHHQARDDYQIIMLDWKLPGMDGLSVARQIRRIVGDDMPIILISAYDWSELEADAKEAGINGFISKPLFKSTLFYGLKKYMDVEDLQAAEGSQAELAGRRVLVAEDNELNWEILQALLSDIGIEPEWAENGQICLEKFQASAPGHYDIILMDVRMPVMNGYEATEGIRASGHPDAAAIPIIAMTADAFSEDIKRCLDCGMNAHTAKPINFDEVVLLLKKYIL